MDSSGPAPAALRGRSRLARILRRASPRRLARILRRASPRRLALAALAAAVLLAVADRLVPPPLSALDRRPAVEVLDSEGRPLRCFLPPDGRWRLPVSFSEVPEDLVRALVAAEDRRFYLHPGVDPLAVARALASNLRAGRVVSGASTISMQVARMARPAPRTLFAKLQEAVWALQLERRLSKRQVLELYLNLAPYGGNVEGVGAAAQVYFGKLPAELSLGEIALLVALPRSPAALDPARDPAAARAARDRVLRRLLARGTFPAARVAAALAQPVPPGRRPPPFAAPHFAQWAADRAPVRRTVATTLDRRLQSIAERAVASRAGELRALGIGNAAAVVLDLDSRAVRAMVGSAGFFEEAFDGQVNGALARRSPGSTLKPFLFAQAYDRGGIVPDSFLLDLPTDFAGYVAENFDGTYRGRVTAREALASSLNAPAVRLLAAVGVPSFLDLLRRGGLGTLDRAPGEYGLPLALGAGEVTLLDLTNLYATLAEGGLHRPPRFLAGETLGPPGEALFSRRAAELVAAALVGLARPDLPGSWVLARGVPAVAWKTGTSFGHRDAWAVGFSARHAIGVWVGNFDGRPVEGISGAEHAGPLLFDLFRAAGDRDGPALLAPRPVEDRIALCAASRELPGPYCRQRIEVPYLPGATRLPSCSVHRRVFLDRETGEVLAGPCLAARPFRAAVLALDPPELVAWWRAQGRRVDPVPALSAACGGLPSAAPPRIVSPDGATPYRLRRGAPAAHQRIPLVARAGAHSQRLFWYEDGTLIASGPAGRTLFHAAVPGPHRLVLVDDTGRSDSVRYLVE